MIQWTTPTITLTVSGVENLDLAEAEEVVVTLTQGNYQLQKTGNDLTIDENTVAFVLTEEESSRLAPDASVQVQVNWTYRNADQSLRRAATSVTRIDVGKQTYKEAMTE